MTTLFVRIEGRNIEMIFYGKCFLFFFTYVVLCKIKKKKKNQAGSARVQVTKYHHYRIKKDSDWSSDSIQGCDRANEATAEKLH